MMAKSRQTKDREVMQRRKEDSSTSMDLISMLPDEILGLIVSWLSMEEATATSLLCRRWRGLWMLTSRLDFLCEDSFRMYYFYCSIWPHDLTAMRRMVLDRQRRKYVGWVNHSLARLAKGLGIQCFKVSFSFTKSHQTYIDGWIRYALSREVQTLKLKSTDRVEDEENYVLPFRLLRNMHLRTISLQYVNVSGEALVSILHNCPLLRDLSVCHSPVLSSVMIRGPFPSFKCLKIRYCPNLELVGIRDVNLVCVKYRGKRIPFLLQDVPMLVHISVELDNLVQFSSILPQLELLNVCTPHPLHSQDRDSIELYGGAMKSVKRLVVTFSVGFVESDLLQLIELISALPRPEKFVLKPRLFGKFCRLRNRHLQMCENLYVNLKEVEFVGYRCTANEIEMVMYFVKNAAALQKILVDTRLFYEPSYSRKLYHYTISAVTGADILRLRAKKQLAKIVPAQINLEIL